MESRRQQKRRNWNTKNRYENLKKQYPDLPDLSEDDLKDLIKLLEEEYSKKISNKPGRIEYISVADFGPDFKPKMD